MIQLIATINRDSEYLGENIGVGRLKAFLEKNRKDVTLTYLNSSDDSENEFLKISKEKRIYGFSLYQDNYQFLVKIMNKIKLINSHSIIVVGSKFATIHYKEILDDCCCVDYVVLGNGEEPLLNLCEKIENDADVLVFANNHKNIATRTNMANKVANINDIKLLPHADRSFLIENKLRIAFINDAEGCVANCSFCTHGYTSKWNGRTAEDLFSEIEYIYRKCNISYFVFASGSFEDPGPIGKKRIERLCNLISDSGYKIIFRYFLRAETFKNNLQDRLLLELMYNNGFRIACVGIDAGNDNDLLVYNKKATVNNNHEALTLLNSCGIFTGFYGFIMFNPYTTLTSLKENYLFLSKHEALPGKYISILYVYKNTAIYKRLLTDGLLIDKINFYEQNGYPYNYKNDVISEYRNFIENHLLEIHNINHAIEDDCDYLLSNMDFVLDSIMFKNKMNEILKNISKISVEFYYYLYIENNIKYCSTLVDDYLFNIKNEASLLKLLRNNLMKQLLRLNMIRK